MANVGSCSFADVGRPFLNHAKAQHPGELASCMRGQTCPTLKKCIPGRSFSEVEVIPCCSVWKQDRGGC